MLARSTPSSAATAAGCGPGPVWSARASRRMLNSGDENLAAWGSGSACGCSGRCCCAGRRGCRGKHRCKCGMEIRAGRRLDRGRGGLSDLDLDGSRPNEPGADSGTRYTRGHDRVDDRRDRGISEHREPGRRRLPPRCRIGQGGRSLRRRGRRDRQRRRELGSAASS